MRGVGESVLRENDCRISSTARSMNDDRGSRRPSVIDAPRRRWMNDRRESRLATARRGDDDDLIRQAVLRRRHVSLMQNDRRTHGLGRALPDGADHPGRLQRLGRSPCAGMNRNRSSRRGRHRTNVDVRRRGQAAPRKDADDDGMRMSRRSRDRGWRRPEDLDAPSPRSVLVANAHADPRRMSKNKPKGDDANAAAREDDARAVTPRR